ncbi:DUF982 domain-containing protein [Rhizobium leguminosarum]|uniref:DUF982 domain-containing protein n=1 Tax=Rhizobium leguminosarum TaxID=384 RepID=UPI0013E2D3FC|nr:DUF982 domain-containing protein [Rhizobium leguminosarum]
MARGTGKKLVINSTEQAAEFLLNEWPTATNGDRPPVAVSQALLDAYDGRISVERARDAFAAAAREAGILIGE